MNNDIVKFIDSRKFSRFDTNLVILGVFLITFTGYAAPAYGSIIPMLFKEWADLNWDQLGYVGSLSEFGSLFGALVCSVISRRFGIKRVLITTVMIFCIGTFSQAFAPTINIFAILRFIAGFGFGGVIPLVLSLLSEYSPKTSKSKSVATALCGNQFGAIIASFVAIYVTTQFGQWRPVFWLGFIPVLLLPYIIKTMPESALFMLKNKDVEGLKRVLSRIDANYASSINIEESVNDFTVKKESNKVYYKDLFSKKYALVSILACVITIMGLLFINGVIVWLPGVMTNAGYAIGSSIAFTIFLCTGTVVGAIFWGSVADKKGFIVLMPSIYFIGSSCLILMGVKSTIVVLYILITLVGFFLFAAHSLVNAFIAQHYPHDLRTVAIGLPNSLGRIGGLLGPALGGLLMANQFSVMGWFMVFAGTGLIAAVSFVLINLQTRKLMNQLTDYA
ncbi:aromatic acid/H+ symport family MFS transporter [Salmonella enterica subsp. enterica serovar Lille]|nr:aromatic acid/H+ symport family MFS transporter [Salmonella enterica subsp. enterica serovar Lille]